MKKNGKSIPKWINFVGPGILSACIYIILRYFFLK